MEVYPLKHIRFWCNKVIPLVYDDSLTYMELLEKCVFYINHLIEDNKLMVSELNAQGQSISELQTEVNLLMSEFEKIKNGDYTSMYLESLAQWVDQNLQTLVARVVKYVFFGLSADGRFVAYIPSSWDFIQFDTDMNPESDYYGHLILRW